jgi:hypothetical protein
MRSHFIAFREEEGDDEATCSRSCPREFTNFFGHPCQKFFGVREVAGLERPDRLDQSGGADADLGGTHP